MNYNGEIKKTVGGQERTFKFGLNTIRFLADKADMSKLEERVIDLIPNVLWAALMVRASVNDLPENFSIETVCDWIDELGEEGTAELWAEAKKSLGFMSRMLEKANQSQ